MRPTLGARTANERERERERKLYVTYFDDGVHGSRIERHQWAVYRHHDL